MSIRQRLRSLTLGERIVGSLFGLTVAMAGFYTLTLHYGFAWTEHTLVADLMKSQIEADIRILEKGGRVETSDDMSFFSTREGSQPLPTVFESLPPGFSETDAGTFYFAWREDRGGETYVLVKDKEAFAKQETAWHVLVYLSGLLAGLTGLIAGGALYRRIMAPVSRLADEVTAAGLSDTYRPLEPLPKRDDVTRLAECCDRTLLRLYSALEREKAFTGDVSHELRTPLTTISGSLELLADSSLTERQRRQVARAQRAVDDMSQLVEDFLQFSRDAADTGLGSPDTAGDMLLRMKEIWLPEAGRKGVTLTFRREAPCRGCFSPVLLATVVNNLIRNALAYTPQGGSVTVTEKTSGLTVEDTAGGIAPEDAAHIFESWYRGSTGKTKGYGLGLSIVARVCRRCKWTIGHANTELGSRFDVTLVTSPSDSAADSDPAGKTAG